MRFEVAAEDAGLRLDQALAKYIPGLSRRKARVLLDIGGVFVDRARVKVASRPVSPGQVIEAHLGGALERATKDVGQKARARDDRALPAYRVVYEDRDIVVVDKPAGLLTAPTPESDRGNLAQLLASERDSARIFVVHRIDLHTSGLLVLAKTRRANRVLSERFRDHTLTREYIAVLAGVPEREEMTIDVPIKGRAAVTHVRVVERIGALAAVARVRLETGRTHQIRIHCQHIGHPVLGDRRYGRRTDHDPPRTALHAALLGIEHPRSGEDMVFESALPDDIDSWLRDLRVRAAGDDVQIPDKTTDPTIDQIPDQTLDQTEEDRA